MAFDVHCIHWYFVYEQLEKAGQYIADQRDELALAVQGPPPALLPDAMVEFINTWVQRIETEDFKEMLIRVLSL